jgi:RNA-directed DNA polymerase
MKSLESLQNGLYLAAKADRGRRFNSLHDKICRIDVLQEAWSRVKANRGAGGVDRQTIEDVERSGEERFLLELQRELREKTYRVQCIRRVFIPKRNGGQRPLGIPTIRDRVIQQAVRLVIEPIFEADFQPFSYGYRPDKSARQASLEIYKWLNYRLTSIIDVDIEGFFDHVNHGRLLSFVRERVADPYINRLIREWLRAGVVYLDRTTSHPQEGTPQGGVISPLLANIYLNKLDTWWTEIGMNRRAAYNAQMVRYADDMVILTSSNNDTEHIRGILEALLSELGLKLSAEKSRVATAREGFDFLSFHFLRRFYLWKGKEMTHFFPSKGAAGRFREKVRVLASKNVTRTKDERQLAQELNSLIIGWTGYFNHSHASETYNHLQHFVEWKFRQFIRFKHGYRRLAASHGSLEQPAAYGLTRLSGRIFYSV